MFDVSESLFKDGEFLLERAKYADRERLAVKAYVKSTLEYIGTITVNLEHEEVNEDEAYLDSNNLPGIEEVVAKLGIGTYTGYGFSGYCMYPRFKFDLEKLDKLTKEYENITEGRSQE